MRVSPLPPAQAAHAPRMLAAPAAQGFQPISRATETVQQGDVGHIGNRRLRGGRGNPTQGQPARAIHQQQTKQVAGRPDPARPPERLVLEGRGAQRCVAAKPRQHRSQIVAME